MKRLLVIFLFLVVCTDWQEQSWTKNRLQKCEDEQYVCFLSNVYGGESISCIKKEQSK